MTLVKVGREYMLIDELASYLKLSAQDVESVVDHLLHSASDEQLSESLTISASEKVVQVANVLNGGVA